MQVLFCLLNILTPSSFPASDQDVFPHVLLPIWVASSMRPNEMGNLVADSSLLSSSSLINSLVN